MKYEHVTAANRETGAEEYLVRMRDGVRLATDVYLPENWEKGPAVLVRLPYDKRSEYVFFDIAARKFNQRGYAVIVQDVRGKFHSEGETIAYMNEEADGYDTIEWVINQHWSDGKVGMFGDSYYGFTQWAAVASQHPALKAIVPRVTTADLATRAYRMNSDGNSKRIQTLWQSQYLAEVWSDNDIYEIELETEIRPIKAIFERAMDAIDSRSAWLDLNQPRQSAVRVFEANHPFDARPLPVLHVVGWFDNLKDVSMNDFTTLSNKNSWASLQYLWADSMDHEGYRLPFAPIAPENDHLVTPEAMERHLEKYVEPAADFFDVFVKENRALSTLPRVTWHLSNGKADTFYESEQWPPPGAERKKLFLARSESSAACSLTADAPVSHAIEWDHDPDELVPTLTKNTYQFLKEYPDERSTAERSDVLVFDTEALETELIIIGEMNITATLESSVDSADVAVRVLDVASDGSAHLVAWGDSRVDTRGGAVKHTIDLSHVAYRFAPGHKMRVQISSSEHPALMPNPGTGESSWEAATWLPATQKLITGVDTYIAFSAIGADRLSALRNN